MTDSINPGFGSTEQLALQAAQTCVRSESFYKFCAIRTIAAAHAQKDN